MGRLEVEGLSVDQGGMSVLRDIDLVVPEGQLVCVLGPSGGGKTTLLRVIAGLDAPARGRLRLDGRDLAGVPPHERGIGLMFQDFALFPHRDVGDNVAFGLRMQGRPSDEIRRRVGELLTLVGLPGAERRSVARLSGGEQQRVALARALAPSPRLLMLDEPMGSLDRSLRERLPDELRSIFTTLGLTVIYVTHDHDEALSVADRVVLLHAGRIVADDPPERLWTAPPSAWAASFLGLRNVAPAVITGGVLETPWGRLPLPAGLQPAPVGPRVTVVIKPGGLSPSPDGSISGTITERRFRGDHVLLGVATGTDGLLSVEARWGRLPEPGDRIRLAVDDEAVHVIDEAGALG